MIYPCLVPASVCTTEIRVQIEAEGLTEEGEPITTVDAVLKCNYQDCAKRLLTKDQKIIQLTGIAYFPGDIAPELPAIAGGTATIYGEERTIVQGMKARNPDGTVNYTRIYLQ